MNKKYSYLTFILLIVLFFSLTACGGSKKENMDGKWKFNVILKGYGVPESVTHVVSIKGETIFDNNLNDIGSCSFNKEGNIFISMKFESLKSYFSDGKVTHLWLQKISKRIGNKIRGTHVEFRANGFRKSLDGRYWVAEKLD
jgi:hypothetical protein